MTPVKSEAVRELLSGIVDYAGLFPPAGLSMEAAVANYARYRGSEHAWMLGAFVVPAARLAEFCAQAAPLHGEGEPEWPLSLLIGSPAGEALETARQLLRGHPFRIAAVECRSEDLAADVTALPAQLDAFFELPPDDGLASGLDLLAGGGRFAKLRTGSVRADEIPSVRRVTDFIEACALRRLPFKATAGLHHPLRGEQALSYEPAAPRAVMHGFLNLFLAAVLRVTTDFERAAVETLVELRGSLPARVEGDEIVLGDERLQPESIAAGRRFARSFGSCSFEEPIADLRRMGWL